MEPSKAMATPLTLEQYFREAIDLGLSNSNISAALQDQLRDQCAGEYCYVCDIYGDAESGNVVWYSDGEYWMAPYEMGETGGKRTCSIDDSQKKNVLPRTVYDEEADEADEYASMESAKLYTEGKRRPLIERFISKGERDTASAGSFAGKGKSFPILKPGDIMAAVRSLGRAGTGNYSADTIKANIKRIAKAKGWTKYLPSSWQDDKAEARHQAAHDGTLLTESATFTDQVLIRESQASTADYHIKLIAPGRGSSGYYPADVLESDGPKVFKSGTLMFWNHQTSAEEASRPEGDMDGLAAVMTSDAYYDAKGKAGPGLYARAKVFSDYSQQVAEKAQHTGLSIRAYGKIAEGKKAPDGRGDVIGSLTRAESVDFVTRPGAGGKVLTESASAGRQSQEVSEMDNAVLTALQESYAEMAKEIKLLREQRTRSDATAIIREKLDLMDIPTPMKAMVLQHCVEKVDLSKPLDAKAIGDAVIAEAKLLAEFAESLSPTGRPYNLGIASQGATQQQQAAQKEGADPLKEALADIADVFVGSGDENKRRRELFVAGRAA